jgi:hypothetical protein
MIIVGHRLPKMVDANFTGAAKYDPFGMHTIAAVSMSGLDDHFILLVIGPTLPP